MRVELIPAVDLRGGRCVRLLHGDYDQETVYGDDPAAQLLAFARAGAPRLHVVDLDAAKGTPSPENHAALRAMITALAALDQPPPLQVGGGVRDVARAAELLDGAGADRVVVGTAAVEDPALLERLATRWPGRIAPGIDTRGGQVATDGWTKTSQVSGVELARRVADLPLAAVVFTDIARDGALSGPNLDALREMVDASPHPVVASGGVSSLDDVAAVARTGARGMIVGRALYTGDLRLEDALAQLG